MKYILVILSITLFHCLVQAQSVNHQNSLEHRIQDKSTYSGNTIRNYSSAGVCININVIGSANSVSIPVETITKSIQSILGSFSKSVQAKNDKLYKQIVQLLTEMKLSSNPATLLENQQISSNNLWELNSKYGKKGLISDTVQKQLVQNYTNLQPLYCNKDKVMLIEIKGQKFYLLDKININLNDITVYNDTGYLRRFKFKNKFGFYDKNGLIVVQAIYDSATVMDSKFSLVRKNGVFYAFIDSTGHIVRQYKDDGIVEVQPFYEHLALIKMKGKKDFYCFFENEQWQQVGKLFDYGKSFSFGKAVIGELLPDTFLLRYLEARHNSNKPFLDAYIDMVASFDSSKARQIEISCKQFDQLLEKWPKRVMDSLFRSSSSYKYPGGNSNDSYVENLFNLRDKDAFKYDDGIGFLKSVMTFLENYSAPLLERYNFSYIDTSGRKLNNKEFALANSFDYLNTARICNSYLFAPNVYYGLIDSKGNFKRMSDINDASIHFLNKSKFPISNFDNGAALVDREIIDSSGEIRCKLPPEHFFSGEFRDGIFVVGQADPEWISKEKIEFKNIYESEINGYPFSNLYFILLKKHQKKGLVNADGLEILPCIFQRVEIVNSYLVKTEDYDKNVSFYNVNKNGKYILLNTATAVK